MPAWLRQVEDKVVTYNMDARDFVRHVASEGLRFSHILMNLPADAIEFTGTPRARACDV